MVALLGSAFYLTPFGLQDVIKEGVRDTFHLAFAGSIEPHSGFRPAWECFPQADLVRAAIDLYVQLKGLEKVSRLRIGCLECETPPVVMLQEVSAFTVSSLRFQEFPYISKIKLMLGGDTCPTRQVQEEATKRHPRGQLLDARRIAQFNTIQQPQNSDQASTSKRWKRLPTSLELGERLQAAGASVERPRQRRTERESERKRMGEVQL